MNASETVDSLLEMWFIDSKIDETEPSKELSKISILHSKYLEIMSHHNLIVKKIQFEYNTQKKFKTDYLTGELNNPEDLAKHNLEPVRRKIMRQDIQMHLDADEQLIQILIKKIVNQEMVDICESIIKEIHNRAFVLGNIVKWEMYTGGR